MGIVEMPLCCFFVSFLKTDEFHHGSLQEMSIKEKEREKEKKRKEKGNKNNDENQ